MSSTINKYERDDIKIFVLFLFLLVWLLCLFVFGVVSLVVAAGINGKHHYAVAVVASPRSCGSVIRTCCAVIICVMRYVNVVRNPVSAVAVLTNVCATIQTNPLLSFAVHFLAKCCCHHQVTTMLYHTTVRAVGPFLVATTVVVALERRLIPCELVITPLGVTPSQICIPDFVSSCTLVSINHLRCNDIKDIFVEAGEWSGVCVHTVFNYAH
jgi:hypothetical protein